MNPETLYSETLKDFLAAWETDSNDAFNFVRQTVQSMEDSFHSASSHNTSLDRIPAVQISEEFKSLNSENFENQSLSTTIDNCNKSPFLSAAVLRHSEISSTHQELRVNTSLTKQEDYDRKLLTEECEESPLIQMRRNNTVSSLKFRVETVYEKIVALEGVKSSIFAPERTPKAHSPMFKTKRHDSDIDRFSSINFLAEDENKDTFSSMVDKYKVVSFDLNDELGLFSNEFIEKICLIEKDASSLSEVYEQIIEHIFRTKNLTFTKPYPRSEIIYASHIDSRDFLGVLDKVVAALKAEEFDIKKNFNDDINFLEAKIEKFARQIGATPESFRAFKSKIKIDETEFKRLYERVSRLVASFSVSDKTKKALRTFFNIMQKNLRLFPTHQPVQDKMPGNTAVTIEYVTVRKLLEKLTECHDTLMTDKLVETVVFTYDHFISPHSLLLYLVQKYYTPQPLMMTFSEYRSLKAHQISTTKLRILDIIKYWVEERKGDFQRDAALLSLLMTFIESIHRVAKDRSNQTEFRNTWEKVKAIVKSILYEKNEQKWKERSRKFQEERLNETRQINHLRFNSGYKTRSSLSPRTSSRTISSKQPKVSQFSGFKASGNRVSLIQSEALILLWDPSDIAKQMTLIDHKYLCKIDLFEMLVKRWNGKDSSKECPNITSTISRFNAMSFWVQYIILNQTNEEDRHHLIRKFIVIASICLSYRNYNSAHVIYLGLIRLQAHNIWNQSINANQDFAKLQKIFDSENFTQEMDVEYRTGEGPAVPSIPYFTKVFFRLQDNISFFAKFDGKEKYLKHYHLAQISEVCKLMRQFQKLSYDFKKHASIYKYLKREYKEKTDIDLEGNEADELLRKKMIEVKKGLE